MTLVELLHNNSTGSAIRLRSSGAAFDATALAEAVRLNTTLERLNLSGTFLNDTAVRTISASLQSRTQLTSLELSFNSMLTSHGVAFLFSNENHLKNLSLDCESRLRPASLTDFDYFVS